jgi:predicted transcriptional regulator
MKPVNKNNSQRLRILRIIQADPTIHLTHIMRKTGMSQNGVRYHVANLIKDGLIDGNLRPKRGRDINANPQQAARVFRAKSAPGWKPRKAKKLSAKEIALQRRIDKVVKAAQRREAAKEAGVNVVYDFRSSLGRKATKLG